MYESPIKAIFEEPSMKAIVQYFDEKIVYSINNVCNIDVDAEELKKALRYDRDQYDKGYADGYEAGQAATIAMFEGALNAIKAENLKEANDNDS